MQKEHHINFLLWIAALGCAVALMSVPSLFPNSPPSVLWTCFLGGIAIALFCLLRALWLSLHDDVTKKIGLYNKKMTPVIGMIIFGVGFFSCAIWYFWPNTAANSAAQSELKTESANNDVPAKASLHNLEYYWKNDFSEMLKLSQDWTIAYGTASSPEPKTIVIKFIIYQDYPSNTKFIGFYIPRTDNTYDLCSSIAENYKKPMDELSGSVLSIAKNPSDLSSTASNELTFSGRIYIYHESELSLEQLGALTALYRSKNLLVQFRGNSYAVTRWLQEQASLNNKKEK